jgi:hypothetical protein
MYGAREMVFPVLSLLAKVGSGRVVSERSGSIRTTPGCAWTFAVRRLARAAQAMPPTGRSAAPKGEDAGPGGEYNQR